MMMMNLVILSMTMMMVRFPDFITKHLFILILILKQMKMTKTNRLLQETKPQELEIKLLLVMMMVGLKYLLFILNFLIKNATQMMKKMMTISSHFSMDSWGMMTVR